MRKYGEQKKLFISPGLLQEAPSKPGLPKPEHVVTPKVDSGESGWLCGQGRGLGRAGVPIPPFFCCPSVCASLNSFTGPLQGPTRRSTRTSRNPQCLKETSRFRQAKAGGRKGALGTWGRLMLSGGALSPQGLSGQDKELVMGLGHLNDSYNFSVSVCEHL